MITNFHDQYITGIEVIENNLEIKATHEGKRGIIKIRKLEDLKVNGFKEGNIINILRIYHQENVLQKKGYAFNLIKDACDINLLLESNKIIINKKLQKIIEGQLIMLEIIPSYGCEIVALGFEIEFTLI